ncbi:site-specific integrase [Vibrio anguillarum]|uniref:site-specific integrase n=1 Tax=Vibrio anguillarum TaxID=55601 RepID=UPI000B547456|nr:site-specific integrase [Vibrio anguillarum]ASG04266.1 hypothetical protein CEJ46_10615 [Vibrio anguillarum]
MKKSAPIARSHIVVKQRTTGRHSTAIPVLYLETDNGLAVMWSLVDYLTTFATKGDSWKRNTARAVGLFYDYTLARLSEDSPKKKILKEFVRDLRFGTIDPETHIDTTGLYWAPSGLRVSKRLSGCLESFILWVECEQKENSGLSTYIEQCDKGERLTLKGLHAGYSIAKFSMMEHVKDPKNIARKLLQKKLRFGYHFGHDPSSSLAGSYEYKSFPTELIAPIIEYGFIKDEHATDPFKREDITAKMIFLLLVHGGLRKGEPLHLWVSDVIILIDNECRVTLRHPSLAPTKIIGETCDRNTYLLQRNLRPRDDDYNSKSYKVGWKELDIDKTEFSADVFWIHESSQKMFGVLYTLYLNHYRGPLMEKYINNHGTDHPFLFVSTGINNATGESYEGAPYSQRAFENAYNKALDRVEKHLNLRIPRGKDAHLNPHCLRHHFAYALDQAGVPAKIIQKCLHHRTINSQEAYKGISSDQVRASLSNYSITDPAYTNSLLQENM